MPQVTETTPFVGAKTCYGRAYRLLEWMGQNGHVRQVKNTKGRTIRCEPSDEMNTLVEALNKGDENTIKDYLLRPAYMDIIHAN